jgi:hypothetical protein
VAAQEGIPNSSSVYADEGTAAHWVLEQVLTDLYVLGEAFVPASRYLGREVNVADDGEEPRYVTVSQEMTTHVQTVVDYVVGRVEELSQGGRVPVSCYAERRVDPAPLIGSDQSPGTADVTLVTPTAIEVIDLKYGRGVGVEVHDEEDGPNGQLMLYLAGVVSMHARELLDHAKITLTITIAQPRYEHQDGPIRSHSLGLNDLHEFAEKVKTAIQRIENDPKNRVASEKGCRWCRAKNGHPAIGLLPCAEHAAWSFAKFVGPSDFSVDTFLDDLNTFTQQVDAGVTSGELTEREVVNLLDSADLIRGLLSTVERWATDALVSGGAGELLRARYKLVEGRTTRRWAFDEDSIAAALKRIRWADEATGKTTGLGKKDLFVEKLASPAQVEKKLMGVRKGLTSTHWEAFRKLVDKPAGAAKLAPITDPGKDISGSRDPQKMFPADLTNQPSLDLSDLL